MVLKVSLNTGINRIRLEFKGNNAAKNTADLTGLIESDWNLKVFRDTFKTITCDGLIESDWNLKYVWTVTRNL